MPKDWQLIFGIQGLIAPKEGLQLNEHTLFRSVKKTDDFSEAFFKITAESEREMNQRWAETEKLLDNLLRIYALFTGRHATIVSRSAANITPDQPLGVRKIIGKLEAFTILNEEQMERYTNLLNRTIQKFESVKDIFEDRRKSYLRNAIDYFYHALGDRRLEEQLIDLMIAMEFLYSKEIQELRLRISQRAAFLLSVGRENERPRIFKQIHDLYGKRSKLIHGLKRVQLSYQEMSNLKSYVRESIKRLIHIEEPKDKILELLDQIVYDEDKRQELEELISESLSHWET